MIRMPLPDHVAIANLVFHYAELIDAGDFEGIGTLFADATITAEGSDVQWQGEQGITQMYVDSTRRYDDGTPRTKHVTTNVMVEVDGDTATARSYYTVMQQTDVLPLQPIICGRYHDAFAKQNGAWRFTDRLIFSDLIGDLSQHLLADVYGSETP